VVDLQLDHTVGAVKATKKSDIDSKAAAKNEMESKALNDRAGAVDMHKK